MATIFQSIFVFLVIGILMYLAFRKSSGCCGGHSHGDPGDKESRGPSGAGTNKATDPVCGMEVGTIVNDQSSTYKGRSIYFCSPRCKERFDQNPERYAGSHHAVHHGHGGCCA